MERIDFTEAMSYNAVESSIHLCRYWNAKQLVGGKSVLDVACGEGYGSFLMRKWGAKSVIGLDVSQEAVDKAKRFFHDDFVQFMQGDAMALPFENGQFDMIVSLETIEHIPEPEKFLREIKRVLKKDGTLVLSCPNDPYYKENISDFENPFHLHQYTFPEFKCFAETVLGSAAKWIAGLRINGYSNLPMNLCNYPETDPEKPESMLAILDYKTSECALVRQEKYTNYWNSVYYLGVWTHDKIEAEHPTAVFYPYPCFEPIEEDAVVRMRNSINQYKGYMQEMNTRYQKEMYTLGQKCGVADEKLKRTEETVSVLTADLACVREQYRQQMEIFAQQSSVADEKLRQEEASVAKLTVEIRAAAEQKRDDAEKTRILVNENERLKIMNRMIEEEKCCQWEALCALRNQVSAFEGERAAWAEKDANRQNEINAISGMLAQQMQEGQAVSDQLNRIEHSKVWKIAKHFFGWREKRGQGKH